jgi:hypothetical protein
MQWSTSADNVMGDGGKHAVKQDTRTRVSIPMHTEGWRMKNETKTCENETINRKDRMYV